MPFETNNGDLGQHYKGISYGVDMTYRSSCMEDTFDVYGRYSP